MTPAERVRGRGEARASPTVRPASWSRSCCTPASVSVASTAPTLASSAVRRCTTSSPPWWHRRLATSYTAAHRRAHIYHVHSKRLYAAIGEPNNRNRKPVTLARAIERLMVLDAVLAEPRLRWLGSGAREGRVLQGGNDPQAERAAPSGLRTRRRARPFGTSPTSCRSASPADGRTHVFLYLVNRTTPVDFRAFLHRHAELLRALPEWELRLLVPRHLVEAAPAVRGRLRARSWAGRFAWTTSPSFAGTSGNRTKSIEEARPEDFRRFRRACRAFQSAAVSRALSALEEERRRARARHGVPRARGRDRAAAGAT